MGRRRVFCKVHRKTVGRHIAKRKQVPCGDPPCRWEEDTTNIIREAVKDFDVPKRLDRYREKGLPPRGWKPSH